MTHLKTFFWTVILIALILGGGFIYLRSFDTKLAKTIFAIDETNCTGQAATDTTALQESIDTLSDKVESLEGKVESTKGFIEGFITTQKVEKDSDTAKPKDTEPTDETPTENDTDKKTDDKKEDTPTKTNTETNTGGEQTNSNSNTKTGSTE